MAHGWDEARLEEAIGRYRHLERLKAECEAAAAAAQVTVHSGDQLVEVVVSGSGEIRRVDVVGSVAGRTNTELSASIQAAVGAAADAARWARRTVYAERLGGYLEALAARPAAEPPR